ncbi:MAG: elongation factor G [Gammaproteobacteria bacterium]|jgi:elongation factor G|nr:elongation factor G [Gammaproteobacteria bacterium]
MSQYKTQDIRNVAIVGHAGSGKTLLAEALLHRAGAIAERGELTRGTTVCDFDPQERAMQHSINVAMCHLDYNGHRINLLDTPGYPDLLGRSISVLPAAETVVLVINAQQGIELGTRRMMEAAKRAKLCRMIVVNRIDQGIANIQPLLEEIQGLFGSECLPLNLPTEGGSAVEDCFFHDQGKPTVVSSVDEAHQHVIDQVVEVDESLMEDYLETGEEPAPAKLHDAFEKALREGHLIPVCFTSAETGVGITKLLDVLSELAPNPLEGNPPPFVKGEGKEAEPVKINPDPDAHAIAHVFKVSVDPYLGKLGIFRIHQGSIKTGNQLFVGDHRKPFKVAHLYAVQGKDMQEIPRGIPGDICAISKVDEVFFDALLHDSHDEDNYRLKAVKITPPMLGLALSPKNRGDEQKLSDALNKLTSEDPSLRLEHHASANETVLYGLGDLHLRVVLEKMKEQMNVDVQTSPPSIPYRETITRKADGHHRHKKQTGGAGQFGEVFLSVEPLDRGEGFEFQNKVVGGTIPGQFIPAVEKGVRSAIESGALAGFPLQDLRVTVYDGKYHPVDSKEIAFVAAGRKAFLDAVGKAGAIVLEPVVNLHINVPANSIGGVTGDLSSMRGRISDQRMLAGNQAVVEGQAPLAEMEGYYAKLKSHSAGEGSYTMDFSHYEQAPPNVQQTLAENFKNHGGSED